MSSGVTLCLTAGGRPDLLAQTLGSLLPYNGAYFEQAFITNDRGDEATSEVVRSFLPDAVLLNHPTPLGHHPSVDEMYARVMTPFIFHCEDDWLFDPCPFIPTMIEALSTIEELSAVVGRQSACLRAHYNGERKWDPPLRLENGVIKLISKDESWRGHSFNPHLTRKAIWERIGPYSKYTGEGDVNTAVELLGLRRASLVPGVYYHIGDGRHMQSPPPNIVRRVARAAKRILKV